MNSEWAEAPKDQAGSSLGTPGAQLAAQREAMGWTVEQIAEQLKLAPRQVRALESGDYAALPNLAVVRGFVRAYAKVVKLDAAPLVAMIEVEVPTPAPAPVPRRDLSQASFTGSRFPSMGERSAKPAPWLVGVAAAVVLAAAGGYAYQSGLVTRAMLTSADSDTAASASSEAATTSIETTLVKGEEGAQPVQSASVPLVSVPPQADAAQGATVPAAGAAPVAGAAAPVVAPVAAAAAAAAPAPSPATAPAAAAPAVVTPAAGAKAPGVSAAVPPAVAPVAAGSPAATAAAKPAVPAAVSGNQLVLKVTEDSWIEIRRPGSTPLISRLVKAGSTETFDIKDPALLIVGKPGGVEASLAGQPLALPTIPGGTISRVNIK